VRLHRAYNAALPYLPLRVRRQLTPAKLVDRLYQLRDLLQGADRKLRGGIDRLAQATDVFAPPPGSELHVAQSLQDLYGLPATVLVEPVGQAEWPRCRDVMLLTHEPDGVSYWGRLHFMDDGGGLQIATPTGTGDGIGVMADARGELWLGRFCDCAHDGEPWAHKSAEHYRTKQKLPWEAT